MVKAYLKYEQVAAFGVIASSAVAVHQLTLDASVPLVATAAVDTVVIWNMRQGEPIARFGNVSTRKAGPITALAVSPRGDSLAAGHADGSIRLWHFALKDLPLPELFADVEPQPVATLNGHRSGVSSLAFESISLNSSDRVDVAPSVLVSGSNDGDVICWNVSDATGKFRLPVHNDSVTAVLLFRCRSTMYILSGSKDGLVKVHDTESQHCVQTLAGHSAEVWDMQLDPTNSILVTGSADANIRMFTLIPEEYNLSNDSLSGVLKVGGLDKESVFKPIGSVQRHTAADRVTSISFTVSSGERYLAVAGADKNAEIFRVRDQKQAEGHRKRREKRKLMSIEKDVKATAEDEAWETEKVEKEIAERQKDVKFELEAVDYLVSTRQVRMGKKLRSVSFLTDKTHIRGGKTSGIELQLVVQPRNNSLEVYSVQISKAKKKGRKKADGEDGTAVEEAEAPQNEIKQIVSLDMAGHSKDVRSCSLSPDETTLLTTSDGSMKLWNIGSQKCIRTMNFKGYGLCTHFIGADGMIGVVGTKTGSLRVFELGSGNQISDEENAHTGEIWSMCLDAHIFEANYLVTGGSDKRVCFWEIDDVLTGSAGKLKLSQTLEMPDQVLCVRIAYGRDRPVLVVSLMDSTVRAFFMDNLEPYLSFYGHRLPVMSIDISSDGLLLVTGSADKTVKIWGMDFGDCRKSLRAHSESVLSVAFQPKTHYFFSGSRDGTVKYWDGDKFEFICDMDGQRGEVWSLTTSDDGEIVASASHDRMVRLWRRTDEPLFLEEERDKRTDEMFESTLVDEDVKSARVARKDEGFMKDNSKGEALDAGKRSLDTVKSGERLLEALQLCEEENMRQSHGGEDAPNPLMLGLSSDAYVLRTLEQIKSPDLEEALHVLPLSAAMQLLEYMSRLLSPDNKATRLSLEMLTRGALYLIKLHHSQIIAGATNRKVIAELQEAMKTQLEGMRQCMGFNGAALQFWQMELADRDDKPFRDASARAFNLHKKKSKAAKVKRASAIVNGTG